MFLTVSHLNGFEWCTVRSSYHRMTRQQNEAWLDPLRCREKNPCVTRAHTGCQRPDRKDSSSVFSEAARPYDHTDDMALIPTQRKVGRKSPRHTKNSCPTVLETPGRHLDGRDWERRWEESGFAENLASIAGWVDG
jgi:hypothetical protein